MNFIHLITFFCVGFCLALRAADKPNFVVIKPNGLIA